ncbi:MAG: MG2 domain-containing protein [Sphingomonas sp.]
MHFKWGREGSLVWVTALSSGQGVGSAEVRVTDSCTGQLLARGTTDASGRLGVPAGLPQPEAWASCDDGAAHPLMVSARLADDFSFTLTEWGEGIRPDDFELPYGWNPPEEIFHTVFDRALVRQGETIHMKHIVRKPVAAGFAAGKAFTGKLRLSHRGSDTQFDLPLTIGANGSGETSWTAPQGAPMGDYDIQLLVTGKNAEGKDEGKDDLDQPVVQGSTNIACRR